MNEINDLMILWKDDAQNNSDGMHYGHAVVTLLLKKIDLLEQEVLALKSIQKVN